MIINFADKVWRQFSHLAYLRSQQTGKDVTELEVLSEAISMYILFLEQKEKGGTFLIEDKDGNQFKIINKLEEKE